MYTIPERIIARASLQSKIIDIMALPIQKNKISASFIFVLSSSIACVIKITVAMKLRTIDKTTLGHILSMTEKKYSEKYFRSEMRKQVNVLSTSNDWIIAIMMYVEIATDSNRDLHSSDR